jgi:tetratricopeptide (TPR) repeat protein
MRQKVLGYFAMLLTFSALAAAGEPILLVARDLDEHLLSGFRFAYGGVESPVTNRAGATELALPHEHQPGQQIKILLLVPDSRQSEEWFLVNSQVNIPTDSAPAEVVLMRRSVFRQLAAEARDAPQQTAGLAEPAAEDRMRALVEAAARHGLTAEQLETALRSFAETQDPKDRGIAAYLEGKFSRAEDLLSSAADKKESDLVETLRYLGATQYAQAKYRSAADTFRKAVALRGEDAGLLGWLGWSFYQLAEWTQAESLLRRALAIDEKSHGAEHPDIARDLNNLALLLQTTNRMPEAELLIRRALASAEKSLGTEHPNVATTLSNLALLLQATNRIEEAERLMRQALAIDERSFGVEHPEVATDLNNLAQLLRETSRFAEAEPLMRRALVIDERSFGPEHPRVAIRLNNLAMLLKATERLPEAERLMRQALAIDEKVSGTEHPNVAADLNNLAQLLYDTKRFGEAEPLLRRALAIDEKSFGAGHPRIANRLNKLALLLQATNRCAEAEPLLRRALAIFLEFEHRTGYVHPHREMISGNYRRLLHEMGRPDAEIDAIIDALSPSLDSLPGHLRKTAIGVEQASSRTVAISAARLRKVSTP